METKIILVVHVAILDNDFLFILLKFNSYLFFFFCVLFFVCFNRNLYEADNFNVPSLA